MSSVSFFGLTTRIGRVRYLAYGVGMLLLTVPTLVIAGILGGLQLYLLGSLCLVAAYLFMLVMSFVLGVRRLHDLDRSGWWMSISAAALFFGVLDIAQLLPAPLAWLAPLAGLAALLLFIFLLALPGTMADNRFGPAPPPNSPWTVAGAWAALGVPVLAGLIAAIAIPAYNDFTARAQMVEAITLAESAETATLNYLAAHKTWPARLGDTFGTGEPAGRYAESVAGGPVGEGFVIVVIMKGHGVSEAVASRSLETWTTDGGHRWHCGPGGPNPIDPRYLIGSCRDSGAP